MKKILSSLVFFGLITLLSAQTNIPGGVLVDLDWTAAESPYIINGTIDLAIGDVLIIDADVEIQFAGHYKFNVFGRIEATGTLANPITFTAQNTVTGWHGLRFINTATNGQDPSEFYYCDFEYGRATGTGDDYRGGAVFCSNADQIVFSHCSFSNNSATTGGAMYISGTVLHITDSIIEDNAATGAGGGIYLNSSDIIMQTVEVIDNISQYDGGGLNFYNSDPVLTAVLVADNFTQWNGGGISAFNNSNPVLDRLTITNNVANQSGSGLACLYNSAVVMQNSIVWGNAANNIYLEPTASLTATYSDLQGGTGQSYFGTGCISSDPLFANTFIGNYSLTWQNIPTPDETKSPCIDSGDPNSALDPDGTRTDMGAFYFAQNGITGTITLDGGIGNVTQTVVTATLTTPPGTVYTVNPDASGNYVMSLNPGVYNLVATLAGYSPASYDNVLVDNELVVINLTLTPPPPGEITGEVVVEGIGNEEEVIITAGNVSTSPVNINDEYIYTLEITPGTYDVSASLPGYETQVFPNVVVESGLQTTGIDFYLQLVLNEGTIAGTVTLIGGAGVVTDVVITAGNVSVSPAADGTYELDILNGTYDVSATLNGYSTLINQNVQVIAFETTAPVDFHLIDGWQPISGTQFVMIAYCTVTYDGEFVNNAASNQLAAFGFDQATGTIEECRGLATWETGNHNFWSNYWPLSGYWYITIVSDNDSGLDNIWFKFYDTENNLIRDCNEQIIFDDCLIYPSGVNLSIDSPLYEQSFDLVQNWNWISFNLEPATYDIEFLFDDLEVIQAPNINPFIYQVKSQDDFGQYEPLIPDWIGGLNFLAYDEGYKVNMHYAYPDFILSGEKINPLTHRIRLQQFYNWISYLPQNSLDMEDALESIGAVDGTYIKTQTQSAVYYGGWIGDLQIMNPGKSYILYWPDEITPDDPKFVDYPPNEDPARGNLTIDQPANPANWQLLSGSDSNMILMAEIRLNGEMLTDDSNFAIGVFDETGSCRSIGRLQGELWYFTVIGSEPETLSFSLYESSSETTIPALETFDYLANSVLGNPRELFSVNFEKDDPMPSVPQKFSLAQNYPNPFNPSTSISYNLPENGQVKLEIFNVKGQLVHILINEEQASGHYQIEWDASHQSSGIYFYKLQWNGYSEIKKCVLMK